MTDDLAHQLNVEGYPTEEGLGALRTFTGTPAQLVQVLADTFGRMGSVWTEPDLVEKFDRKIRVVRLATGGWSGNEDMIGALRSSFFWFAYWEMSRRGGGYTFHVPVEKWDTPMPEWPPAMEPR